MPAEEAAGVEPHEGAPTRSDAESGVAPWWKTAVIYEIYPRSFQDTDGDGLGDLRGVIERLDYLEWLGVDAIWVAPVYPSPMADFGYDVADYVDVDPRFGSLHDVDALIAEAHRRGIRVLLDFVPNHTSDQHPWFVESRSSRADPKRDWYLWHDPAEDGGPPTNWQSDFGGSGWAWDERTRQYYYHSFLAQQPDLNWRHPEVQAAMADVLRFWLDRGVDGFRVDVIWHLVKDDRYRDDPVKPDAPEEAPLHERLDPRFSADRPEVHDVVARLRSVLDEYDDDHCGRVMVGETYLSLDRLVRYYGEEGEGVHLAFNFHLLHSEWRAPELAAIVEEYERLLPPFAWPSWALGNHDQSRLASRVGEAQARVAAMLLLTLRGTPTLYYGDEIGMRDVDIPLEQRRDPVEFREATGPGRDPARTPMRWEASDGAGFTSGDPWLPVGPDAEGVNVAAQRDDPASILHLYRALLELRREPALRLGTYRTHTVEGDLWAYEREREGQRILVALNLGGAEASLEGLSGEVLLSTHLDRRGPVEGVLRLRPDEGVVVRC